MSTKTQTLKAKPLIVSGERKTKKLGNPVSSILHTENGDFYFIGTKSRLRRYRECVPPFVMFANEMIEPASFAWLRKAA